MYGIVYGYFQSFNAVQGGTKLYAKLCKNNANIKHYIKSFFKTKIHNNGQG